MTRKHKSMIAAGILALSPSCLPPPLLRHHGLARVARHPGVARGSATLLQIDTNLG
jgi:hypothetical protein